MDIVLTYRGVTYVYLISCTLVLLRQSFTFFIPLTVDHLSLHVLYGAFSDVSLPAAGAVVGCDLVGRLWLGVWAHLAAAGAGTDYKLAQLIMKLKLVGCLAVHTQLILLRRCAREWCDSPMNLTTATRHGECVMTRPILHV